MSREAPRDNLTIKDGRRLRKSKDLRGCMSEQEDGVFGGVKVWRVVMRGVEDDEVESDSDEEEGDEDEDEEEDEEDEEEEDDEDEDEGDEEEKNDEEEDEDEEGEEDEKMDGHAADDEEAKGQAVVPHEDSTLQGDESPPTKSSDMGENVDKADGDTSHKTDEALVKALDPGNEIVRQDPKAAHMATISSASDPEPPTKAVEDDAARAFFDDALLPSLLLASTPHTLVIDSLIDFFDTCPHGLCHANALPPSIRRVVVIFNHFTFRRPPTTPNPANNPKPFLHHLPDTVEELIIVLVHREGGRRERIHWSRRRHSDQEGLAREVARLGGTGRNVVLADATGQYWSEDGRPLYPDIKKAVKSYERKADGSRGVEVVKLEQLDCADWIEVMGKNGKDELRHGDGGLCTSTLRRRD